MTENMDAEQETCFIVMPITTPTMYADCGDSDHFTHVLQELFIPALESLNYKVLKPSVSGSELIHAQIIKNLEQADLVLCDLSSLNPNVFFELGIRTALDRSLVLVRDKLTTQIPFDLNAINVLTYDGSLMSWTVKEEIARLAGHVAESTRDLSVKGNPIWRYFGLTKRASPAEISGNPLEGKLDLIISEITRLPQQVSSRPRIKYVERFRLLPSEIVEPLKQIQLIIFTAGLGNRVDDIYFTLPGTIRIRALEGTIRNPTLSRLKDAAANAGLTLGLDEWC